MRRLDMTGERYGKLVAVERLPAKGISRWKFKCDCGNETVALLGNIRGGQITSCGCEGSRNSIGKRSVKHGHASGFKKTKTLAAWRNAKTRCFNESGENYSNYGGRGITMCKEWSDDFRSFVRDMGECPKGLSLDRIDVNGNYEPGNCRWATSKEQAANTRINIYVETANGRIILKDFAAANNVSYKMLHRRVRTLGEDAYTALQWFRDRGRLITPVLNETKHKASGVCE